MSEAISLNRRCVVTMIENKIGRWREKAKNNFQWLLQLPKIHDFVCLFQIETDFEQDSDNSEDYEYEYVETEEKIQYQGESM